MKYCYLNNEIVPMDEARISPLDRGFLFGDGVYEVMPIYRGRFFHLKEHLERLSHSLEALFMEMPMSIAEFEQHAKALVEKEANPNGTLYVQVTRGVSPTRLHYATNLTPTVFMMVMDRSEQPLEILGKGFECVTQSDTRWHRCQIKSISLLAHVLHVFEGKQLSAFEPILIRDGCATEGASTNIFIVKNDVVITPPSDDRILNGITRQIVIELLEKNQIPLEVRNILEAELREADEIWITSSTREILPIIKLDGKNVGTGLCGPMWTKAIGFYKQHLQEFTYD